MVLSLNLPEYWEKTDPANYDLTLYDTNYLIVNPSSTKSKTHNALATDIKNLIDNSPDENQLQHLKNFKAALKHSGRNKTNVSFWENLSTDIAKRTITLKAKKMEFEEKQIGFNSAVTNVLTGALIDAEASRRKNRESENYSANSSISSSTSTKIIQSSYNYMAGGGKETSDLLCDDARWVLKSGDDVSELFMTIRSQIIKKYKKKNMKLDDLQLLAMNFIFLFTSNERFSISNCFSGSVHDGITEEYLHPTLKKYKIELPGEVKAWCHTDISKAAMSKSQVRNKALMWMKKAENHGDNAIILSDIIHRITPKLRKENREVSHDVVLEDTYIHKYLHDLLESIFDDDNYDFDWANKKINLDKNNMNSGLFKPDFMVFSTKRSTPINMFVAEVKPPNGRCRGLLNDTTKLCFEMKLILDIMINLGIKNPTATGLCVEGRTCTGYRMKLDHEAVYMVIKLFDFQLPSTTSDFSLLPKAVESMLMLKAIVDETAACILDFFNDRALGVQRTERNKAKKYQRPTFIIEEINTKSKKSLKRKRCEDDEDNEDDE
ncbi:hypothetical protein BDA99DRAFT_543376 [Phascolomyces articulosus]|uniref:Uncharacterized protein n=1 Tax=Phascolomyces articulosus TaxID=60185 RepID=A0AAD5JZ27_9FUNG|nr:hypothetical protein BDA99DRAFT_543376 [Phascolomyces articulosus]